jgi:hypothetical protein
MQPLVLSGARTIFSVNGSQIAAGFVMDYRIDTSIDAITSVDNILEEELAPSRITVFMNVKVYRTPDNDPVTLGIAPQGGDQSNPSLQANPFSMSPYIVIEVRDRITDKTVLYLPRARLLSRSGTVQAEDLHVETWSLRSIGYMGPGQQVSGLLPVVSGLASAL